MVAVDMADEKASGLSQALEPKDITLTLKRPFSPINLLYTLWLFTESDFVTFVIPDTCFGVFGALSGSLLTLSGQPELLQVLYRGSVALLYNWGNLLVFDLANQGTFESVLEDRANKPWRPIPTGRITVSQTRKMLMWAMPIVLALNWRLGQWAPTSLLFHLTWMYNHLGGGEDSWLVRNLIISVAFGLYNYGSLVITSGADLSTTGYQWTILISAVIGTTMHVQDMKDQVGDALRGRRTCPLVLGDIAARWTIAISVAAWSVVCPWFLGLGVDGYLLPCGLGTLIALRILLLADQSRDRGTWKIWTAWTALLYLLPVLANPALYIDGKPLGEYILSVLQG